MSKMTSWRTTYENLYEITFKLSNENKWIILQYLKHVFMKKEYSVINNIT